MSALEELASRCGIEEEFEDARGEVRRTSPDTRRALLGAMGFAVDDDEQARAALEHLDRVEWNRVAPPVTVLYPGNALTLEINLAAATGSLSWRITLEDGGVRSGEARVDALELIDRRRIENTARERRQLVLNVDLPLGYHQLRIEPEGGRSTLIVTPGQCWLPTPIREGRRLWGVSAQLYLLRSALNWGIGDYGDLRRWVDLLKRRGADVVGLNPLHALFLDEPEDASPYSPASRLLLNVLNIDVTSLPELDLCGEARALIQSDAFQRALERCRHAPRVDYTGVADLKLRTLRLLFAAFQSDPESERWQALERFRQDRGETFERGCVFLALREHFAAQSQDHADWHAWPPAYRDPTSPAVTRFAEQRADLVRFHAWLQFIADAQLAAAARAARSMAVGLYRDLAVGADRRGEETWSNQTAVVASATVGAPPDIYNPPGQDWGLPPFNPVALREEGYQSFINLVRANMRHAGGLRIDHVMALQQLYWVPRGQPPTQGAYVRYPLNDLVGILALESQRNHCLIVGEDLGTVPAGFRERMAQAQILSYRVLFFERDDTGFRPPHRYPQLALAVAGSHDLPTLRAWWEATDLKLKESLHLFPTARDVEQAWAERERDRNDLLVALRSAKLNMDIDLRIAELTAEDLIRAAHAFLARSTSAIAIAQLDDITDESTPVNVPTTSDEHPNWRRRMSLTLEQLARHPRLAAVAQILRAERSKVHTTASTRS